MFFPHRLTYTLTDQQAHGMTQMSFLLPEDHRETSALLRELRAANSRTRYDIIEKQRLLMNNTYNEDGFIRPAELHFIKAHDRMQLTDAYSVQEGHFIPYSNNPHDICAFHMRQEECTGKYGKKNTRYLFTQVGFGDVTDSENSDLLTETPPLDVRGYLFLQKVEMMNYLRNLQPDYRQVRPAALLG